MGRTPTNGECRVSVALPPLPTGAIGATPVRRRTGWCVSGGVAPEAASRQEESNWPRSTLRRPSPRCSPASAVNLGL